MFENNNSNYYQEMSTRGGKLQATFFGKVMWCFALAMLSSAVGVYLGMNYLLAFFMQNPLTMWLLFGAEIALIFTASSWMKNEMLAKPLFALFTMITGITIAPLLAVVASTPAGAAMIGKALFATTCVFAATGIIGYTTKRDLSGMRGFLIAGLIGLIVVSILGIFFPWGNTMELAVSGFGILIFSGFVLYDFQQIKNYPEDAYMMAAMQIYLNFFNLFVYILRFMLALSGRE